MSRSGMQSGEPFTYEDLARWPSGADRVEIYEGGLLYSGEFTAADVAVARRTYPDHEVYLDEGGLWILPSGTGALAQHLARINRERAKPSQ